MIDDILFTHEKHIGLITLNRPQALNALTLPMILAMQEQLQHWQDSPEIHAIVVRAAEGKAFCAGGDVRWLYDAGLNHDPQQMQFFWHEYRLNHFIHHLNKPYIALMDGVTMGGGVGISLHGSHPVAGPRFLFAMPETSIGFFPDVGASHLLSRCPGSVGVYLGLTGHRLGAVDACALGLVKQLVATDQFDDILTRLIETDLSIDAHARVTAILQDVAMPMSPAPINEQATFIHHCFQQPSLETISATLADSDSEWHCNTLTTLSQKAPLSLKVTLAQLKEAATLSLAACLNMDYCLVSHFMQDHDFYEGVRALLVDKDKSPKWQPNRLEQVDALNVASYFERGLLRLPL